MNVNGYTLPSGDVLDVLDQSQINISNGSDFVVAVKYGLPTTIHVSGTDTLVVGSDFDATAIVDLAKNATWIGHIDVGYSGASMFINGPSSAVFENDSPLSLTSGTTVTIGVNVTGNGKIGAFQGTTTFERAVGSGQQVDVAGGTVIIDEPKQFSASTNYGGGGAIDLVGLAKADSYTFQNDMLSIYNGKKIIDTLKLTDSTQYGIEVQKTSTGVSLLAYADAAHTPIGTPLPIHI